MLLPVILLPSLPLWAFELVSVDLGATQTSPARSPTKVYTPLEAVSPTTQNPPEDLPIQETSTGSNEGIERVLATSLDESAGSGQLLIHDTTNGSSEIPIEEIELSDKNVTVTEDNDQTLATTTEPNVEELPQVTFNSNCPRFTEFINMVRDATTSGPN